MHLTHVRRPPIRDGRPTRHPPRPDGDRSAQPAGPRFQPARAVRSIEWDVRTAYDFVFSLSDDAGSTDDLPAADRAWLAEAKADLRRETGEALDLYGHELCIVLAGLAIDHPEVTDAASFMRLLDASDDRTVLRTIIGDDLRDADTRDTAERAIDGDPEAIAAMAERVSTHHDPAFSAYVTSVYSDPPSVIDPARQVLAGVARAVPHGRGRGSMRCSGTTSSRAPPIAPPSTRWSSIERPPAASAG